MASEVATMQPTISVRSSRFASAAIASRRYAYLAAFAVPFAILPPAPPPATQSAFVVQPMMPQASEWTRELLDQKLRALSDLSTAGRANAPLLIWPEMPGPLYFDADPRFRDITGNIVFPGFTAPKLVWVKNNEPSVFAQVAKVLLPKDYLRLWLAGERLSEMSDSAGTSWLNVAERRWSPDLLAATDLDESRMPSLVEGTEKAGALRAELAARWGMTAGIPIAGGAGDNAASACGMGTVGEGHAFVSLGTSGVLFAANTAYLPNPESAVHTFCHALPQTWHQMGVILSAADSLTWLSTVTGKDPAHLAGELGDSLRAPTGVTFLPYLSGERTPYNDSVMRGAFAGLEHESGRAALTQAVLEGVAFAFRDCLEALRKAGTTLERVTAIGGGSRSRYWLKAIATALGIPVDIPADGDFGAAFGAARLGMIAATGADPLAVCTAPGTEATIDPDAGLSRAYADAYGRYRALYPAIRGTM